ncbi:MAG: hypothetical protein CMJ64_18270 [Planctomycetaceae bacterium]|nr:hypothetical protein [Planctomycetaceae bacterium]
MKPVLSIPIARRSIETDLLGGFKKLLETLTTDPVAYSTFCDGPVAFAAAHVEEPALRAICVGRGRGR